MSFKKVRVENYDEVLTFISMRGKFDDSTLISFAFDCAAIAVKQIQGAVGESEYDSISTLINTKCGHIASSRIFDFVTIEKMKAESRLNSVLFKDNGLVSVSNYITSLHKLIAALESVIFASLTVATARNKLASAIYAANKAASAGFESEVMELLNKLSNGENK